MKKLLMASAMLLTLAASVFAAAHPRTYVLDMVDGGASCDITYNQYGPNYQGTPEFTKFMKGDKPIVGDTIEVHMKVKTNVNLSFLGMQPVDTSAQANYWTPLAEMVNIAPEGGMKAGQEYTIVHSFKVTTAMQGAFKMCFQYDNPDQDYKAFPKVGKAAKLTFVRKTTSTDTSKEIVKRAPKAWTVDLTKYAAFMQIQTNHPWVNGKQDMAVISNYEGVFDISKAFDKGKSLPIKGDTITVTYRGVSNIDIESLKINLIENSAAVNWWAVICEVTDQVFAENIKKGEAFEAKATFKVTQDAQECAALQIYYNIGEAKGPAIIKFAK